MEIRQFLDELSIPYKESHLIDGNIYIEAMVHIKYPRWMFWKKNHIMLISGEDTLKGVEPDSATFVLSSEIII